MKTLRTVVAEVLRVAPDSVGEETSMMTLPQWDSLKHMEIIFAIEDTYGLTLDGDEIAAMTSIPAIEALLRGKGATP